MAGSDRDEAMRRRSESRSRRRDRAASEETADSGGDDAADAGPDDLESHEALRRAAKVAAAGAAVGAAVGAARALTSGGEEETGAQTEERGPEDEAGPETSSEDELKPVHVEGDGARETPGERERVQGGSLAQTTEVVQRAREQLLALQGREPETVSALERTPEGWTATFEVVELARVPDSTDVMASYEVVLDEQSNVLRYGRVRRYYRSQADQGGGA